jgi:hypothetical protein
VAYGILACSVALWVRIRVRVRVRVNERQNIDGVLERFAVLCDRINGGMEHKNDAKPAASFKICILRVGWGGEALALCYE